MLFVWIETQGNQANLLNRDKVNFLVCVLEAPNNTEGERYGLGKAIFRAPLRP